MPIKLAPWKTPHNMKDDAHIVVFGSNIKKNTDAVVVTATVINSHTGEIIEKRQGEFSVKLDNVGEYPSYPYMDSFKYYSVRKGILYNSSNFDYDYELTDTEGGNGSCSECGGAGRVDTQIPAEHHCRQGSHCQSVLGRSFYARPVHDDVSRHESFRAVLLPRLEL